MKVYRLEREQRIPIGIEAAWAFFSNPRNLAAITPAWLSFHICDQGLPDRMRAGILIQYTVRPLLGIPITWVTEITHTDEPEYFVDEQRFGPYRMWHHQHTFEVIEGGVLMCDRVDYVLPFGLLGRLAHWLMIRKRLAAIFDFRYQALVDRFGELPSK